MAPLRVVLVDDEPLAIDRLDRLLLPFAETLEVVGRAYGGREAVATIEALRPDLVFLDIQMPELDGFAVLEHLTELPLVIFSTAHDEYALKAFETHSIDYLLKPVEPERLARSIDKLERLSEGGLRNRLASLLRELQPPQELKRLQVRVGGRIRFVPVRDVLFLRARDKYVEVTTAERTYLHSASLTQLESLLPSADFVRIHRSLVVALDHVAEIVRSRTGGYRVRIDDAAGTLLPVSRRFKGNLGL